MSTIRIAILSAVLTLVVAVAVYFAAVPLPAMAAQPGANCPIVRTTSVLTTQQLRTMLDGRYQRRVALPY